MTKQELLKKLKEDLDNTRVAIERKEEEIESIVKLMRERDNGIFFFRDNSNRLEKAFGEREDLIYRESNIKRQIELIKMID